jgi:lantibiotic modifying enzyme
MENGWELERKHLFVLSASGKPIFSRYGDEQEIVSTFGLLQAFISIVLDSNDSIQSMKAGNRKIVFFTKNSLYFVAMSFTNEPEIVLLKQLQFLYSQMLFAVTAKVHDLLHSNPSLDIRQLVGVVRNLELYDQLIRQLLFASMSQDTFRLMHESCATTLCPNFISFESLPSFVCKKALREELTAELKVAVNKSGAA